MKNHTTIQSTESPLIYLTTQLLDDYRTSLRAANRSSKTISWYQYILSSYSDFLISEELMKPIDDLGQVELRAYVLHLQNASKWAGSSRIREENKGELSPHTVQGHVRATKAFWSWLAGDGYIEKNPLAKFPLPKVPQYLMSVLTRDQIRRLLGKIDKNTNPGARYYCIMIMLLDTGMRISELVRIKMVDLDLPQGVAKVFGKGQRERVVPFSRWTRRELLRYINKHRSATGYEDSTYLFPAADGEHVSINSVQQYLRRLSKKAGLDDIRCSPHVFRHTFATEAIANGGNVFAVKDIMGHSSLQTTMKYTHLKVEDLKNQHAKFSPVEHVMNSKT